MRKLNLDLDEIAVESFATANAAPAGGTVRGMESVTGDQDSCATCGASCATCGGTCPASCPANCVNTCATCPASCDPVNCPSVTAAAERASTKTETQRPRTGEGAGPLCLWKPPPGYTGAACASACGAAPPAA